MLIQKIYVLCPYEMQVFLPAIHSCFRNINPLMPTVAIKHPVLNRVKPSFVIFDIQALTLSSERQSVRMSKITNEVLT